MRSTGAGGGIAVNTNMKSNDPSNTVDEADSYCYQSSTSGSPGFSTAELRNGETRDDTAHASANSAMVAKAERELSEEQLAEARSA